MTVELDRNVSETTRQNPIGYLAISCGTQVESEQCDDLSRRNRPRAIAGSIGNARGREVGSCQLLEKASHIYTGGAGVENSWVISVAVVPLHKPYCAEARGGCVGSGPCNRDRSIRDCISGGGAYERRGDGLCHLARNREGNLETQ